MTSHIQRQMYLYSIPCKSLMILRRHHRDRVSQHQVQSCFADLIIAIERGPQLCEGSSGLEDLQNKRARETGHNPYSAWSCIELLPHTFTQGHSLCVFQDRFYADLIVDYIIEHTSDLSSPSFENLPEERVREIDTNPYVDDWSKMTPIPHDSTQSRPLDLLTEYIIENGSQSCENSTISRDLTPYRHLMERG